VRSSAERNIETQMERKTSQNLRSFGGDDATCFSCSSFVVGAGIVEIGESSESGRFSALAEVDELDREGAAGCDILVELS
jgi:hypothetical protein